MNVDQDNELTGAVIGAAIAVHRALGPGVDEAADEEALSAKLTDLALAHERQKPLPIAYKGVTLDCRFRLDLLVEGRLPLELKAVEITLPIHEAQLLTYMRLGEYPLGLLINFEVALLKEGVRRMVLANPKLLSSSSPTDLRDGFDPLSGELLHAALEVHRALGPGLLRSAYEECLCQELSFRGLAIERCCQVPLWFEDRQLVQCAKVPLVVAGQVPVFCLSVASLTPLHEARLLARLRQTQWPDDLRLHPGYFCQRGIPVAALSHNLEPRVRVDHFPQAMPEYGVVVHDQHFVFGSHARAGNP
ncbi:MAG: GxxExxY protein [Verrucomicrobiia bacterium]